MKQKGGPSNNEHCFQECSAWTGILVHLAEESAFSFTGIRMLDSSVSQIVRRNMRRAGITAASYGSHILRHTAATEMLRRGVSLFEIGSVLRHRSADMSAYYAKVDMELLKLVVQPWPEVLSC